MIHFELLYQIHIHFINRSKECKKIFAVCTDKKLYLPFINIKLQINKNNQIHAV